MNLFRQASPRQKLGVVAACLVLAPLGFAQEVVSVRAGFIHHTEGSVFLEGEPFQHDAANAVHVEAGQKLRTEDGRAEMMFALGTLLRLDANSELQMIEGGMTSASARLISGSAIIDSIQVFDPDSLSVMAREAKIAFPKDGYYRIDARTGEPVTLKVFRGKAQVSAEGSQIEVKGNRAATIENAPGDWSVAKFNRKETDSLDQWSKARAKAISQANQTLLARGSSRDNPDRAADQMMRFWLRAQRNRSMGGSMGRGRGGMGQGGRGSGQGSGDVGGGRGGQQSGGQRGGGSAGGGSAGGGRAR